MCPGFDSRTRCHMWVEFVGSLPCSERFFSGYFGFPLSSKPNISKFQFDLDYCQALYHEPLARVIAQALPVFDIKFTFTFLHLFGIPPSGVWRPSAEQGDSRLSPLAGPGNTHKIQIWRRCLPKNYCISD